MKARYLRSVEFNDPDMLNGNAFADVNRDGSQNSTRPFLRQRSHTTVMLHLKPSPNTSIEPGVRIFIFKNMKFCLRIFESLLHNRPMTGLLHCFEVIRY